MIYRAICYCTHERMQDASESVVFIQAAARNDAAVRLTHLLADIWDVPEASVDFYNLDDTHELYASAVGGAKSGDARYFEVDSQGGALTYLLNDAPLFLLRPKTNRRLLNAWKKLYATPDFESHKQFWPARCDCRDRPVIPQSH
jgi:hypothetical protein